MTLEKRRDLLRAASYVIAAAQDIATAVRLLDPITDGDGAAVLTEQARQLTDLAASLRSAVAELDRQHG